MPLINSEINHHLICSDNSIICVESRVATTTITGKNLYILLEIISNQHNTKLLQQLTEKHFKEQLLCPNLY